MNSNDPNTPAQPTDEFLSTADKAERIPPDKWDKLNLTLGGILGALGAVLLLLVPETATFGSYRIIAVALLMLILPRYVENQVQRSIARGRIAMLIAFAAVFAVIIAVQLLTGRAG